MDNIFNLTTEMRNKRTMNIDNMSTIEMLTVINEEDQKVALAVKEALPKIAEAVDAVYESLKNGGKLFYVGAGTSGRIGILDAVECPPTYSTPSWLVQAVMAGGSVAMEKAKEGAEDREDQGAIDLEERNLTELDVVIGIAASGRTPYVTGALKYAKKLGAKAISLTSNKSSLISQYADIKIEVETGPEVITGSTRMKAASAHKMILNMISTSSMIKVGKVYENLMVDLHVSNKKLEQRAKQIVSTITGVSIEEAGQILAKSNNQVKPAIVMIKSGTSFEKAKEAIEEAKGFVRQAIQIAKNHA
ncbi:N-acetylmuramic acid 6-phosphate etherase [Bacillus oleivorans]|uniref:N-acetylmuramic acid 6-phosphate etherase n=1 Tax=Bacillus oleivorans TaxID=1448271 RepID=A0A285D2P4_9BACI|nr:N-acetylmuramic acid 6-phosphate etherase [Bacillus oleivorans]SNX74084.1 N-acetylmuramic acid 6-phosphate etherase [Bacillus oleivorans]